MVLRCYSLQEHLGTVVAEFYVSTCVLSTQSVRNVCLNTLQLMTNFDQYVNVPHVSLEYLSLCTTVGVKAFRGPGARLVGVSVLRIV
jgi:hypothetical protein